MEEQTRPKRGRAGGRPPGQPNHPVVEQRVVPPRCSQCRSTNLKALKRLPDQDHRGTAPDGQPYTRIIRRRMQCQNCGQHIAQLEYIDDAPAPSTRST